MAIRHLSPSAIFRILIRRGKDAGVEIAPHDCRRSLASDLLDSGADLNVVKEILGHERIDTTARYDRRDEKAQQSAIARIHVPFKAEWFK
jgi:site-specific recombinase XerD